MDFELQNYRCPLCKHDSTELVIKKQGFNIVRCRTCEFVYVNPRIKNEQLATIYQHHYFANKDYGYVNYEQEKRLRVKNFERWLSDAASYIPDSSSVNALDVGCAAGYCLDVMKNKAWDVQGLELDEELFIELNKKGYNVFKTPLQEFDTEQKFDVITLFDVIEHIPDIDIAFAKLNSLLANDGIVIMVTPDHDSFQSKVFGKKWFQYKPIEHIQYFTKKTLRSFADRNGLRIVSSQSCGQYTDTQFIINRLNYYHFPFLANVFGKVFSYLRIKKMLFYLGTGSRFVILKKK